MIAEVIVERERRRINWAQVAREMGVPRQMLWVWRGTMKRGPQRRHVEQAMAWVEKSRLVKT